MIESMVLDLNVSQNFDTVQWLLERLNNLFLWSIQIRFHQAINTSGATLNTRLFLSTRKNEHRKSWYKHSRENSYIVANFRTEL